MATQIKDISATKTDATLTGTDLAVGQAAAGGPGSTFKTSLASLATWFRNNIGLFGSGNQGAVPASGGGTTNFLRADGTWSAPPGAAGTLPDGDYGDIVVGGTGTTMAIDAAVATAAGRNIMGAADASAQRTALGLGTAATNNSGDFEAFGAVAAHAGAPDPHPTYASDTDLANHAAAGDPHTGYQLKSEKGAANGYAGLNASGRLTRSTIEDSASGTIIGRATAGPGSLEEISCNALGRSLLNQVSTSNLRGVIGSPAVAHAHGIGELSMSGTPDGTKFLRDDGTWAVAPGAGSTGFTEEGGQLLIPGASAAGGTYPEVVFATTGAVLLGSSSAATNGLTVAPGVTCAYQIDIELLVQRTSGTTAGYVTFSDNGAAQFIAENWPVTVADATEGTVYRFTTVVRVPSGTRFGVSFNRGANGFDYSGRLVVKRVSNS